MKSVIRFFYILLLIIALGIASYFFFGNNDEMVVVYFYDETTERKNNYQEVEFVESLNKPLKESKNDLVFRSFDAGQIRDSVSKLAEINSRYKPDFILLNTSVQNTTYITDYYFKEDFPGISPILLNMSKNVVKPDNKFYINLLPQPEKLADSILKEAQFGDNLLIITDKPDRQYDKTLAEELMKRHRDSTVLQLNKTVNEQADSSIESIIDELNRKKITEDSFEKQTDLLLILETKKVVTILEKIVGYPRDRIFVSFDASDWETLYYGGTNIYGVRGFALTKPISNVRINHITQYIKEKLEKCSTAFLSDAYEYDNRVNLLNDYLTRQVERDIHLVEFYEDGFLMELGNEKNE